MTRPSTDDFGTHPLRQAELARLGAYKAAVQAGFFTDACPDTPGSILTTCAPQTNAAATALSERQMARLAVYWAAMQAGVYSDYPIGSRGPHEP
jgi:hypothetical protein